MKLWTFAHENESGESVKAWCPTKAIAIKQRQELKSEGKYVSELRSVSVPTDRCGLAQFLTDIDWH